MKILSVGNSFSQDAHQWLKGICDAAGVSVKLGNLMIGGCSLERHWDNVVNATDPYSFETNGIKPGEPMDIQEAIAQENWDIVTLQQASHFSGQWDTYEPFLSNLADDIRKQLPKAKLYIHETWAYETDSKHDAFGRYDCDQKKMYTLLKQAYQKAAVQIGAPLIPVGDVVQFFRENVPAFDYQSGGLSLCRDGFHLSLLYGRYLASAVWFETLLGGNIVGNTFLPESGGETADPALIRLIQQQVHSFLNP